MNRQRLSHKRDFDNRPRALDKMTDDELIDEKIAVQKALLYLESVHGRPANKEDRNLARPIYDRYRILKRMITKAQPGSAGNELATIHEDETMNFITPFTSQISEVESEVSLVESEKSQMTDSSDTDTSISDNFQGLSKIELVDQQRLVSEEKKELRRSIKVFEAEVQRKTGRMVLKEDKVPIQHIYAAYKKAKAKLKLLDALVGKQM